MQVIYLLSLSSVFYLCSINSLWLSLLKYILKCWSLWMDRKYGIFKESLPIDDPLLNHFKKDLQQGIWSKSWMLWNRDMLGKPRKSIHFFEEPRTRTTVAMYDIPYVSFSNVNWDVFATVQIKEFFIFYVPITKYIWTFLRFEEHFVLIQ